MTLHELRSHINSNRRHITAGEIEDLFDQLDEAGWQVLGRQFEGGRGKIVDSFIEALEEQRATISED